MHAWNNCSGISIVVGSMQVDLNQVIDVYLRTKETLHNLCDSIDVLRLLGFTIGSRRTYNEM